MAKELLIVFIYDCELCKTEEDDPQNAIIYFYPTWVSNEQRHALCSQLMGVTQFCSTSFSLPNVISLQSGKFALKNLGRYTVCVGTDRNIPDVVLETRVRILYNLLRLFHNNIETLQKSLVDEDISDKLSELLQVYLPILQYATNTFGNIPVLKIPKSSSTLYLEAKQTLQGFQEIQGVLGGVLLYQNKVVTSQLNKTFTKQLVVTDPYRIKLPAETVVTPFHLPFGVQLMKLYVPSAEIRRLQKENQELVSALKEVGNWRKELQNFQNLNHKSTCIKPDCYVSMCGLKRDVSRIFTVLEEEGNESLEMKDKAGIPDVVRDAVKARHLARIEAVVPNSFIIPEAIIKMSAVTPDDLLSTRKIPIRYYSIGLPQLNSEWCDTPPKKNPRPYYNTICDPKYPLFKYDGLPASLSLSQSRIMKQFEGLKDESHSPLSLNNTCTSKVRNPHTLLKMEMSDRLNEVKQQQLKMKSSFTLPLKSSSGTKGNRGIPLTPLLAKLSLLAEEGTTIETPLKTPSAVGNKTRDIKVHMTESNDISSTKDKMDFPTTNDGKDEDLIPSVLYVFGSSNTSVLLLIEPAVAVQPEVIHSLWERSMASLKHMEGRLSACLNATECGGSTEYSYSVVDPAWGPIERGGAYHPHQLELLTILHHNLAKRPFITDILVRSEDTITYGYQCAETQVFYQENNCMSAIGLPTPSDLMGVIPLKARRILERDHGILLL